MVIAAPISIGGIVVAPSTEATVILHCTALRKNGLPCNHIVARVPLEAWEQFIVREIEPQCATCGTPIKLGDCKVV